MKHFFANLRLFPADYSSNVKDYDPNTLDADVKLDLPEGQTITPEQLTNLTKKLASVIEEFLQKTYSDAKVAVCK